MTRKNCIALTLATAAMVLLYVSVALCATVTPIPSGNGSAATVKPVTVTVVPFGAKNSTKPVVKKNFTAPAKVVKPVTPAKTPVKRPAPKAPANTKVAGQPEVTITGNRLYNQGDRITLHIAVDWPGQGTLLHSLRGQTRQSKITRPRNARYVERVFLGGLAPGAYDYEAIFSDHTAESRLVRKRFYVLAPLQATLLGPTEVVGNSPEDVTFTLTCTSTSPDYRLGHVEFLDYAMRRVSLVNFRRGSNGVQTRVTRRHPGNRTFPYYAKVCDNDGFCSEPVRYDVRFKQRAVIGPRINSVGLPIGDVNMSQGDCQIRYHFDVVPGDFQPVRYEIKWRVGLTRSYNIPAGQTRIEGVDRFEGMAPATWRPEFRVIDIRGNASRWFRAGQVNLVETGRMPINIVLDAPNRAPILGGMMQFNYTLRAGGGVVDQIEVRWNRGLVRHIRNINSRDFSQTFVFSEPFINGLNPITIKARAKLRGGQWTNWDERLVTVEADAPDVGVRVLQSPVRVSAGETMLTFQVTARGSRDLTRLEYIATHEGNRWQRVNLVNRRQVFQEVRLPVGDARSGTYRFSVRVYDKNGVLSNTARVHYVIQQ